MTADKRYLEWMARNIINQILDGAVELGGYKLEDMKKRQAFNDIADVFVVELLEEIVDEAQVPTEYEWALESRTFINGPFDKLEPLPLDRALELLHRQKTNLERFGGEPTERLMVRSVRTGDWKAVEISG